MKERLESLDVLRGLTVAMMILVNNGYGTSFAPLEHAKWNGLTPCDLVFPFFLFMVGVSVFISLSRHAGEPGIVRKIVKRTILLFVIGVALHAWDMIVWGDAASIPGHLRVWGVLQRIALSYCFAALFFNLFKGKYLWQAIAFLLVVYSAILLIGNGYSEDASTNLLAQVDRNLFGEHLYKKALDGRSPVDPEGLVGVIAGVAHVLIGVVCGKAIMGGKDKNEKVMRVALIAVGLMLAGFFLSFGLPFNKRIWSPSYTLVTCGMAAGFLSLFTWVIDVCGYRKWCRVFVWFGMNALFVYIVSEMLPSVIGVLGISEGIYHVWSSIFGETEWASLCYALTIDAFMALLAWMLYVRKIFVKL